MGGTEGGVSDGARELRNWSRDISESTAPRVLWVLGPRLARRCGRETVLACPTEACEGGWCPLPKSSVLMPSANASRKGQEKPREIVDAAEVRFLLPRVGERAEGGRGAIGRAWCPVRDLQQAAAQFSRAPAGWTRTAPPGTRDPGPEEARFGDGMGERAKAPGSASRKWLRRGGGGHSSLPSLAHPARNTSRQSPEIFDKALLIDSLVALLMFWQVTTALSKTGFQSI